MDVPRKMGVGGWHYFCKCKCGSEKWIYGSYLKRGRSASCGCNQLLYYAKLRTHGLSKTHLYRRWRNMLERCEQEKHHQYHNYGGRGIKVSEEWHDFEIFLKDMGHPPTPKHSIDRIDNDGPYCKTNCRWATEIQQKNNTRRTVHITHNGLTLSLTEWARHLGMPEKTIIQRIWIGWTPERALTEPFHLEKARFK